MVQSFPTFASDVISSVVVVVGDILFGMGELLCSFCQDVI